MAEIADQLIMLKREHRDLDAEIERLALQDDNDEVTLKRLKKRKLLLRDRIAQLEMALIPDEPA